MSKQQTAIKPVRRMSPANVRPKARVTKAEAQRLADQRFIAAGRAWHLRADSILKRRAYIRRVCQRIAAEFQPEKIILFGSYAYGKPTLESDVDLLVVMEFEGGHFMQAHKITQRLSLALPLDLLVYTPAELRHRLEIGDSFVREIVARGRVMYEAHHAGMD